MSKFDFSPFDRAQTIYMSIEYRESNRKRNPKSLWNESFEEV